MENADFASRPQERRKRGKSAVIFFITTALAIAFVSIDSISRFAFLEAANRIVTSEEPQGTAPSPARVGSHSMILPSNAIDTRWWVIYAGQAESEKAWRIRHTKLDNHPTGREVHWSSGTLWLLRGISATLGQKADESINEAHERATLWTGIAMLALCGLLFSILVGRRYGWGIAGFHFLLLATCLPFYEAFRAGETDHHGLVLLFTVGSVLSLVAGGAGLTSPGEPGRDAMLPPRRRGAALLPLKKARLWFTTSGLLGACALWVSAASIITVLAGCAIGALGAALSVRKDDSAIHLTPELWLTWSRWGGAGCLFFYLLEYFPAHMGWRLEVNHPLYALAWIGAGGLLCRACKKLGGGLFVERGSRDRIALAASFVSLLVPAALVLLRPDAFFWVRDPFLLTLLTDHVRELRSTWLTIQGPDLLVNAIHYFLWPLLAVASMIVLLRAGIDRRWRALLMFVLCAAAVIQLQALIQVRWAGLALGLWSICIVVVIAAYLGGTFALPLPRSVLFAFGFFAIIGVIAYPQLSLRGFLASRDVQQELPQSIVPTILLRDIAHRLVQAAPSRIPVVLTDPTSATELAYFGGIRVLGTLYWENTPGLKAASHTFAAPTETRFRELLEAAKVTHLVIPSWDGLSTGESHLRLLQKAGQVSASAPSPYLDRVLRGEEQPLWLRPYHYPIPEMFGLQGASVRIFELCPKQSRFEAYYFQAVYLAEKGALPAAAALFEKALVLQPGNPTVVQWLRNISVTTAAPGLSNDIGAGNERAQK